MAPVLRPLIWAAGIVARRSAIPTLRCAILDDYQDVARSSADWRSLAGSIEVDVFNDHIADRAALADALAECAIVVAMRERTSFDQALLARLPTLQLIVTTGMRNASIDLAAAAAQGVVVCGTRSWPGTAAELTWALILALVRDIPHEVWAFNRGGRWQSGIGCSLYGATLGVVGLGNVGQRVAAVARAFEMNVIGRSRTLTAEKSAELGISRASTLEELLRGSDIVSMHVSLNAETRGMIGARELALMKPTAYLVNTSRGPVVDEAALIDALATNRIAGAALDVFDREPLPGNHPLRTIPHLIGTPHVGYVTRENYRVFYGDAVENIVAWQNGAPMRVLSA